MTCGCVVHLACLGFLRDESVKSQLIMAAGGMTHNFEGNRIAVSDQGMVAVVNKREKCVVLYGKGADECVPWMATRITMGLSIPYDVCFAPNNSLAISDIGDNRIKIYKLEGGPQQANQIVIGNDPFNRLIVRDLNSDRMEFPFRGSVLALITAFRIPQNLVIGPGPASRLFVTSATDVLLINIDWNNLNVVGSSLVCSPNDWCFVQFHKRLACDNVSAVQDHKANHRVGGFNPLAITEAQFCAIFYHVTATGRTGFSCLKETECKVGKRGDRNKFAETVVIYVRLTEKNGRLLFHARYGNCYEGAYESTTHAEYFMLADEQFRQAIQLLRDQKGGFIDMFMNKQPCFRSTGHGKKTDLKVKDCAKDMVDFYNLHCIPHGIKLTIHLCQLYKVDMLPGCQEQSLVTDIRNARLGVKMMFSNGIELKAMTRHSWSKLAEFASITLPTYQNSDRQRLDHHVHRVLDEIKRTPITPLNWFVPR